ncbi:hypothetical protein ACKVE0_10950 [Acinetobacter albensis]|uniref:Uncharacterized protein n=1 Tax=Acinetobacter albensis TaxID=1673609 RepID=A0ABW9JWF2_9GAMM|nr:MULTISPECIES: hypothetical protein [Acinetobacter]
MQNLRHDLRLNIQVCCNFNPFAVGHNGERHQLVTEQSLDGKKPDHFYHQAAEY